MQDFLRRYVFRDLYQPHTWWGFDGPYSRIQLDDGSTFVTIMSSVWNAKQRPHLCHVGYYPTPEQQSSQENEIQGFSCDFFPKVIHASRQKKLDRNGVAAFELNASIPEEGASFHYEVNGDKQTYRQEFLHPSTMQKLDVEMVMTKATPHSLLGPMWIARFLPIPLKWHIFSTRSKVDLTIRQARDADNETKTSASTVLLRKQGLAHMEKNWGIGFPTAWIWCQGFASDYSKGSLAIAGGAVTSFLNAFMVAYRSPISHRTWNFGPASTIGLFGYGFLTTLRTCSSATGELKLECSNPFRGRKIVVTAKAPVDSFAVMSAPLPKGHTTHYCHESFIAKYTVTCFERSWFGKWRQVEEIQLENSALEFGGTWSHWWMERLTSESKDV